jgi:hypothetical protein
VLTYWKERRIRNRLLMREVLLRVEAKRVGAPGRSGAPTEYFRQQRRRLLWRHPRFAIEYLRATKQSRSGAPAWQRRVNEARLADGKAQAAPDFTS